MLTFALVSCSGQSRLEKLVKNIDDECPVMVGELGEMASAGIEDGNVVITILINEDVFNIDGLEAHPDVLHQSVLQGFRNPTDDMKELLNELKRCDAGLTYVYKGRTSGKTVSVTLTNEEVKEALKAAETEQDPDELLDAQVAITVAQLPIQVDEITLMTDLVREDGCVVYYYDVDESVLDLDELEANSEAVVEVLTASLQQQKDSPGTSMFIRACKQANADIVYRYKGTTTGKIVSFTVDIDAI